MRKLSRNERPSRPLLALAVLAIANFAVVLDATVVNVALPSIGSELQFSERDLSWVINAYVLTFGGLLLFGGRAADLFGRRRVFLAGLGVFTLASLAGGLATSSTMLIAARAVQGVGAAMLAPAALALVTGLFDSDGDRNKALGIWGAVAGSGAAVGVLLGGVLTDWLGWEAVLFINVPIGAAVALLTPAFVPAGATQAGHRDLDLPGAFTSTAAVALVVYAIVGTDRYGWGSTRTVVELLAAGALAVAFVVVERRAQHPLIPASVIRRRSVIGANAVGLVVGGALTATFYFLSLYLQQLLHYSPLQTGLAQLPLAATIVVVAGAAGPLVTRLGVKRVMLAGLTLFAGALVWFVQLPLGGSFTADLLAPSLVMAAGLGLAFVPMTIAAVERVGGGEAGVASGLLNTSQQVGGALGLAIAATLASTRTAHQLAGGAEPAAAVNGGFHLAFLVAAGFLATGAIVALLVLRREDGEEREREPTAVTAGVPVAAHR